MIYMEKVINLDRKSNALDLRGLEARRQTGATVRARSEEAKGYRV